MEFHNLGSHCAVEDCKLNDFLPFECQHCHATFCKNHFQASSHNCKERPDNYVSSTESDIKNFLCSEESCEEKSPVEIPCVKCKLHFCVGHRYHGCLEMSQEEKLSKLKKWQRPKAEFTIAKSAADEEVKEALKKSKNIAMANKVQLMRLKGKATGDKRIPTTDRRYFLVHPAKTNCSKTEARPIFVNVQWSIGKVTDTFAKAFNISNANNFATAEKLRIFDRETGAIVAEQMDTILSDVLNNNTLIDGQSLILEYSNTDTIDPSPYK